VSVVVREIVYLDNTHALVGLIIAVAVIVDPGRVTENGIKCAFPRALNIRRTSEEGNNVFDVAREIILAGGTDGSTDCSNAKLGYHAKLLALTSTYQ
jgi:hypothetical protein